MEPESGLIFKNMSSLANLNLGTKFEFTLMFLHNKLIGKKIQQNYALMILLVSNLHFSLIE